MKCQTCGAAFVAECDGAPLRPTCQCPVGQLSPGALANLIRDRLSQLSGLIDQANDEGLIVQLTIYHHDGSEGTVLDRVSGEIDVVIGRFEEL